MIIRIQNSNSIKVVCLTLAFSLFIDLVLPRQAFALTGGPAQPEFNSFTPIGTSDMVDLSSGDMSYNIPLMDVGGYPLNLAYSSGVSMDQEASHVGLGWNLSVGQINRNVRGLPDDFNGDKMKYENHLKPNVTVGLNLKFQPAVVGVETEGEGGTPTPPPSPQPNPETSIAGNVSVTYNNYTGLSVKPGLNLNQEYQNGLSVGFSAQSGPDGLTVSPNVSLKKEMKREKDKERDLSMNFGVSMNSRQGFGGLTLGASVRESGKSATRKDNGDFTSKTQHRSSVGSSISFTDPVYTPNKRVGMETSNFTLNAEPGGLEIKGIEGAPEITAYGTITRVKEEEKSKELGAYGYEYTENAGNASILDFNREKDASFSINTKNLAVTNYTYDIYSVQGQGVSGTFRGFRNQVGYVYDSYVSDGSFSGSLGIEVGTGDLFKFGVDLEVTGVASHSGPWLEKSGLQQYLDPASSVTLEYEKVHYKNVGDLSADYESSMFNNVGGYQPALVPLAGFSFFRRTLSAFGVKQSSNSTVLNNISINSPVKRNQRVNRNQAIHMIKKVDNLAGVGYGPLAYNGGSYQLPNDAQNHHTTEVQVIRNDGARYIYGLPAYNTKKKEATFSVNESGGDCETGLVSYAPFALNNPETLPNDKYLDRVTTPAYVHTHLLTSVLSTDYQDVDGTPGPSEGDLGSYTKFSYTKKESNYKWRVPYQTNQANYNEGLKTDSKDGRGSYIYGEKELYYVDQVETKTHVAVFHYSERKDGKGVKNESGGYNAGQSASMYKLDKISLYSRGEYDGQGVNSVSTPIKEVYLEYSYSLCPGIPNNSGVAPTTSPGDPGHELSNHGGKLTLKKVYFKYRNSAMGKYTGYRFNYGEYAPEYDQQGVFVQHPDEYSNSSLTSSDLNTVYMPVIPLNPLLPTDQEKEDMNQAANVTGLNPEYHIKGYDSWGNYLPNIGGCGNLNDLTAAEFPFVEQDDPFAQKNRSAVWNMRKIDLPSGGTIEVEYESDEYAYVQDKEVMRMYKVAGAGIEPDASGTDDEIVSTIGAAELFKDGIGNSPKRYLYIEIEDNDLISGLSNADISSKYLKGIFGGPPIYFRFLMNMTQLGGTSNGNDPAKYDYVTGYLEHEETATDGEVFLYGTKTYISIPVKFVDKEGALLPISEDVHPISKAAWHFGRKYLNNHVYSSQPNGDTEDIQAIVSDMLNPGHIANLLEIFTGPNARLENKNVGRQFIAGKSWLRLKTYNKQKFGGGCRVREIRMSDRWNEMTPSGQYETMKYGQKYEYALENGSTSGVATYEPVGNKENPLVQPEFTTRENLLAPDEENFVEMPFGECFFPSPTVTYSRVSVRNVDAGVNSLAATQVKQRNKTGRVVTEFYTSKDFPTIVDQTAVSAKEDKTPLPLNLLNIITTKHLTMTQGYVIHLNDMNGKQKSQRVYAEGQATPISGVDYKYRMHTGNSGFSSSSNPEGNKGKLNNRVKVIQPDGSISYKTIGVETDMVVDYRENATTSEVVGVNTNLSSFLFGVIPIVVPMPIPDVSINKDQFRSVSTTKVINTFGLLDETIAYDAGATVYTKNLAWDSETGEVLVTETVDEYDDKYYTMNYPAHWFYKGMGQASKNLGLEGTLTSTTGGYSVAGVVQSADYLIPGDELYLTGAGASTNHAWVSNIQGNTVSVIDENGAPVTSASGTFKVMRSGRRNLQSAGIMNVTLMHNPLTDLSNNDATSLGTDFLESLDWDDWRIINAGAVDYSQRWPIPCECVFDNSTNGGVYNPYRFNERGVWRTKSSRTYLTGRNSQGSVTPRQQGFFESFAPMYQLTSNGNWYKNFNDWTYVAEVSKYSPYGFELENKDALDRFSAAQYGYNNTFPMAVGANTEYREIGFDGFEDYIGFDGCPNAHFTFKGAISPLVDLSSDHSHTGKYSLKVGPNDNTVIQKLLDCENPAE